MRFDTIVLDEKNIGREIERFVSITDRRHWERVISNYDKASGITYRYYLTRRNPLIEPLKEYFKLQKQGRSIWKNRTPQIEFLAMQAFTINNITKNLSKSARSRVFGRLKSDDIRPLLFELRMSAHFFRNNFDVEFVEYEGDPSSKTFDFLISKDSVEGEVECKFKSYDAGKSITTDGFYQLSDEIYKKLLKTEAHCLIEIKCLVKLGKNRDIFVDLSERIKSAVDKKDSKIVLEGKFEITIHYLSDSLIVKTPEQLDSVIKDYLTPRCHVASLGNDDKTLIIKIESVLEDSVVTNIYNELKDSLDQFSGERPGLIACHIEGVFPNEWEQLKGDSALGKMTRELFLKDRAKNIHTVGYSSTTEVFKAGNFKEFQNPGLMFRNPNCVFDKWVDIFCFEKDSKMEIIW